MTGIRRRWGVGTVWPVLVLGGGPAAADEEKVYPTIGTIERSDRRVDRLVPRDATMVRLAEGFDWAEDPAWDRSGGHRLFSDVPRNTVFKWKEGAQARAFLNPSGCTGKRVTDSREPGANGLVFDPGGRLVLCQHGDRRVARLEADGRFTTLADRYRGKRFNSPNDAVFKANSDLYFTDPPYGLRGRNDRATRPDRFRPGPRRSADVPRRAAAPRRLRPTPRSGPGRTTAAETNTRRIGHWTCPNVSQMTGWMLAQRHGCFVAAPAMLHPPRR